MARWLTFFFLFSYSLIATSNDVCFHSLIKIIDFPLLIQPNNADCGVMCVQGVGVIHGVEKPARIIRNGLGTDPLIGTDFHQMERYLKNEGFHIEKFLKVTRSKTSKAFGRAMRIEDLEKSIDNRQPVIVLLQAYAPKARYPNELESGHYVVAIGYDGKNIYFMDPNNHGKLRYLPKKDLLSRWKVIDSQHELFEGAGLSISRPNSVPSFNLDWQDRKLYQNLPPIHTLTDIGQAAATAYSIIEYFTLDYYHDDILRKIELLPKQDLISMQGVLSHYAVTSTLVSIPNIQTLNQQMKNKTLVVLRKGNSSWYGVVLGKSGSDYMVMDPDVIGKYRRYSESEIGSFLGRSTKGLSISQRREEVLDFSKFDYLD